jgi:autotransporter-associated beta strand protein
LHWTGGAAPTGGNDYFTGAFTLRTPGTAGDYTFAGDSLSSVGLLAFVNLGDPNALQQATFVLLSTNSNLVKFSPGLETFTLGGLAGTGSFGLTNTSGGTAITLQVGNNNAPTTYAGRLSGGGSLTKLGSATLTFAGTNSYSGSTLIANGTLTGVVGGSCANSDVTVAATAGNTATLGVSITNNAKQWTCSSLTFNNAGTSSGLQFSFDAVTPSTTAAPLNVAGSVAFTTAPTLAISGSSLPVNTGDDYPSLASRP